MIRPGEALMFVMETLVYIGVAWWAYRLSDGTMSRILLSLGAIAVMGLFWALFAAPHAPYALAGAARLGFETVWVGLGVAAFVAISVTPVAVILAGLFVALVIARMRAPAPTR